MMKVQKVVSCWIWVGAKNSKSGYGLFNGKPAHRMSYMIFKGEIPPKMCVCHVCDNPICVNPEHLFIGSHQDNCTDAVFKRLGRDLKTNSFVLRRTIDLYYFPEKWRKETAEIERKWKEDFDKQYGMPSTGIQMRVA